MDVHPYQGNYKTICNNSGSDEPADEFDVVALAKRLNISLEDMKNMSFVSLANILISSIEEDSGTTMATQDDIKKYFG